MCGQAQLRFMVIIHVDLPAIIQLTVRNRNGGTEKKINPKCDYSKAFSYRAECLFGHFVQHNELYLQH